ncbi:MAG: HDOD domain-containing protein [Fibrobacteria bacterium]|nr:HDOD domain-containing protein [Fibrobacteria bacterium]
MQSLLVVDDQEVFRTPLVEALRSRGYDVREASTAPAALEMAMRRKPALVLLDLAMPNIDGFELLRYFRARAMFRSLPVILLTAHARRDYLAQAASMGVKDYLLKSAFSLQDLFDRIEARIGSPYPPGFAPPRASPGPNNENPEHDRSPGSDSKAAPRFDRAAFLQHIELRALPGTVAEVLALAADPHASLAGIESVLRRDPSLSAQVMILANSPGFLRGSPCQSLEEALRVLGMAQVVRIVSTGAVLKPQDLVTTWGVDLRSLWSHSLAAGLVCQRLHSPREEALGFLLGLLHELPEIMALTFLGDTWEAWKRQGEKYGWTMATTLGKAFQCEFADLVPEVLARIRLPEPIAAPIREHHEFFQGQRPVQPRPAARVVEVAHQMAVVLGRSGSVLAPVSSVRSEVSRYLHDAGNLARDMIGLDSQILMWEQMMGLVASEESSFPVDPLRVSYWRGEEWLIPDPLEALLQKSSNAHRLDALDEMDGNTDLNVILAEPGSEAWSRAGKLFGKILLCHSAAVDARDIPRTLKALRLPITESQLLRILHEV